MCCYYLRLLLIIVFEKLKDIRRIIGCDLFEPLSDLCSQFIFFMKITLIQNVIPGESIVKPDIKYLVSFLKLVGEIPVSLGKKIPDGQLPPCV